LKPFRRQLLLNRLLKRHLPSKRRPRLMRRPLQTDLRLSKKNISYQSVIDFY
jgi:hypothetical protein